MQRSNESSIKMLSEGKLLVKFCTEFNTLSDTGVLKALVSSGIYKLYMSNVLSFNIQDKSIMVESPVFYKSYQSTLEALKSKTADIPFESELVQVTSPPNSVLPACIASFCSC